MSGARDNRLDNAKGILIILVVYAHTLSSAFQTAHLISWYLIYLFHMPAFLIISGYLSARRIDNKDYGKAFVKIIIPYLLAQFALYLMFYYSQTYQDLWVDSEGRMVWLQPSGALWYLLALFVYIVITAVISGSNGKKSLWIAFTVSILLVLVCGMFYTCYYLRFTKMVCFYPFFLLGYILSRNGNMDKLVNRKLSKLAGLALFAGGIGIGIAAYYILYDRVNLFSVLPMESRGAYFQVLNNIDYYWAKGPLIRMLFIVLAILISIGFVCLVPKRKTILAYIGKYSMYIYILHWFCIRALDIAIKKEHSPLLDSVISFITTDYRDIWLLLPVVTAICFALASKPVRFLFRPFLQPDIDLKRLIRRISGDGKESDKA